MNVLVCPDKFKGSLTARQVCKAVRAGIRRHSPATEVTSHPMSDGGDGMLDILTQTIGLQTVSVEVCDPLFRPVQAQYGVSRDGADAYVEMSRASGLVLLAESERDCLETTTYGTGELIADALRHGVRRIVLGIGGSATNDGGFGVGAALGYRLLDANGEQLIPIGRNLGRLHRIDDAAVVPELAGVEVTVASDVQNPLHGPTGAAWTFARQKGADDDAIERLDRGLMNFARVVRDQWGLDLQRIPGSGAAGGLGGGAIAFLGAKLRSGIEMMIEVTALPDRIAGSDLVITGEGRLDEQTLQGKVIDGVLRVARDRGKRVAVVCGSSSLSHAELERYGITDLAAIMTGDRSLADAMSNAAGYLEDAAFELAGRLL